MIGILEGEHWEKGEESIFEEIMAYNFSGHNKKELGTEKFMKMFSFK